MIMTVVMRMMAVIAMMMISCTYAALTPALV